MNPNATLRRILDACHDHNVIDQPHPSRRDARDETIAALKDLRRWLTHGGSMPNAVDTCDAFLAGR